MKNLVLYFPIREEMMSVLSAVSFLLKKQGSALKPICAAETKPLEPFLAEEGLDLLACDVTAEGILPLLEKLRHRNPEMKLVLLADETIAPVCYIRPSILPSALLWRPICSDTAKEVFIEVFHALEQNTDRNTDTEETFLLDVRGTVRQFPYRDILMFESRNKRIYLHLQRKEVPFPGTLEKLMEILPEQFIRVHKSIIVNRGRISEIQFGQNMLILDGGTIVPISRSYKTQLKAVFS